MIDDRHPLYLLALSSLSLPGKQPPREVDPKVLAAASAAGNCPVPSTKAFPSIAR